MAFPTEHKETIKHSSNINLFIFYVAFILALGMNSVSKTLDGNN